MPSTAVTTGGRSRCCTTSCPPTPTTPRPRSSKPTPTKLGYQQEVPQYRAIFLTAAKELREAVVGKGRFNTDSQDTILAMPIDLLFDFVGVHIIGDKASEVDFRINLTFAEHGDKWTMWVRNGVLNGAKGPRRRSPALGLAPSRPLLVCCSSQVRPANSSARPVSLSTAISACSTPCLGHRHFRPRVPHRHSVT